VATNNTRGNYGERGATVPPETQAEIIELCRQGVARNEIARRVGVGTSSVSGIVKRAGLNFDRSRIKKATEARQVDLAAKRARLQEVLLDDAMRLREQIWQPHEYVDHGGKDFDEARWTMDEPTPADKHKLMQAASAALGRSLDLAKHDTDDKAADARAMLTQLGAALGVTRPDA